MRFITETKIFRILVIIWVVLWINFIARDLFRKRCLKDYIALAGCNAEEKHAYTYGKGLYEFLKFVKNHVPEESRYELEGIEEFSLDSRRSMYYLYPLLKEKYPEYILVYGKKGYGKHDFERYRKLDEENCILRKR